VRGQNLYGRGACDDKGQLFAHVKTIESYLRTAGRLPVNVKCLFEGEEEIGSPNLKPWLARHRRDLAADVAVMSDTRMLAPDRPAVTYALRGSLGLELEVRGPEHDLHSGNFGGAVHNPLQALCEMIARLHDPDGRIAVPGFYDRVRRWGDVERGFMARNGPSDAEILRDARARKGWGERGYSLYERTTICPALTVNGITGGYQGPGGKAVIPAHGHRRGADAVAGPAGAGGPAASRTPCRGRRLPQGLRSRPGVPPLGRYHSRGQYLPGTARRSDGPHGLRPAR
jgi:acetylornithine deacetylase/succinyl-diaminopimelate desuccinylase-like protein